MKKFFSFLVSAVLITSLITGCTSISAGTPKTKQAKTTYKLQTIRVASQYGLQYAPAQIMEKMNLIEKYLPGVKVEWQTLPSGAAINESIIAGKTDIAFTSLFPFLISFDKGVPMKLCAAIECGPNNLMTYRSDIKSIKDFKPSDRIAMPSITSAQYFLLAMASEKILGNPHALDKNIVAMDHPTAYMALLTKKDIVAHFSSAPYVFDEQDKGMYNILDGKEAYGGQYTHIYAVTSNKFHNSNPQGYSAFMSALNQSINEINTNPKEAAKILSPIYKISADKTYQYLTGKDVNYSTTPYGIQRTIDFLYKYKYISKKPKIKDISFDDLLSIIGKMNGEKTAVEKLQ